MNSYCKIQNNNLFCGGEREVKIIKLKFQEFNSYICNLLLYENFTPVYNVLLL